MSSIVIPCICILCCYIGIFVYVHKRQNQLVTYQQARLILDQNKSFRIAVGLFASFMLFTICWLPYGIIVMIDYQDRLPRNAVMFTMSLAHLNSCMNPIWYALFNPTFRMGYRNLYSKIFSRSQVSSLTSPNT